MIGHKQFVRDFSTSVVMTLLSSNFSCFMVFVLKCRFCKFKKYLEFFSPSLYQRALDLKMAPRVWYWEIFSNWRVLMSSSLQMSLLAVSDRLPSSSCFRREEISDSKVFSFDLILAFFSFAYFNELERICIFMVSQRSTASTSTLFLYSLATLSIVFLIRST